MSQNKIYEQVTDKIISLLEKGVIPWQKPWKSGNIELAKNMISKKEYQGINFFITNSMGYSSPLWGTYNQILSKGGQVKAGEKGTIIVFWKTFNVKEKNSKGEEKNKTVPLLRYFHVFNAEQCENLSFSEAKAEETLTHLPLEACEKIKEGFPLGMPELRHNEARAFYSPSQDFINLPMMNLYTNVEEYYQTLFHECIHATGHKSRLNRATLNDIHFWGDENYSQEELVAEMGASYLAAVAGIDNVTIENSTSYLQGWLHALRKDSKLLIKAAAQAQKAVDYLLQTKYEQKAED